MKVVHCNIFEFQNYPRTVLLKEIALGSLLLIQSNIQIYNIHRYWFILEF